jgi:D-alanyl-D-alanine carboxypeptidase
MTAANTFFRPTPTISQTAMAQLPAPFRRATLPTTVVEIIKPRSKPGEFDETPFQFRHHPVVAAIAPTQKPALLSAARSPTPQPKPVVVASITPPPPPTGPPALHPRPVARPAPPGNEIGEGDIGDERESVADSRGWVIQIGAFPSQTLARSQLAAYAEKSMDVLGQASRVVAPIQSVDGHTVYRARFGPFAEREAREVCSRLTQRGQTCFASVATR